MDEKYWFYIVIGAVYFLSRFLKKSVPNSEVPTGEEKKPGRVNDQGGQPPRQLTFEELLREITEAKQVSQKTPPSREQERPAYVDYDENLEEEAKSLETIEVERAPVRRRYEEYEGAQATRLSLEETMKLSDSKIEFGKFKAFEAEQEKNLLNEYTRAFRDPQGLKSAIVMSEILNRKF